MMFDNGEFDVLLAVHVERDLRGTERLVLPDHVLHVARLHAELAVEIDIELDVGAEDFDVAILVAFVALRGVLVHEGLEFHAVFDVVDHVSVPFGVGWA